MARLKRGHAQFRIGALLHVTGGIQALLMADIALKETRVSSEDQLLATAILALCAGVASEEPRSLNALKARFLYVSYYALTIQ